jgi:UDP-glucose 4-epimerase
MKIIVTGSNGLIGQELREALKENHEIIGIGLSIGKSEICIDFTDDWNENDLPTDVDVVIHLAQSPHFRDFPNKAKQIFYTNTLSTLKLISWAKNNGVKKFIYASSAGIYGNRNEGFSEDQQIVYNNELGFYLGTKHCSEVLLDNYAQLLTVIQLRFFFVYGKHQKKDMLIPRLVENIRNGKSITLQGEEGIAINPIHVSDAAKAIEKCLTIEQSNKFNIAGPNVLTLKQISEIIGTKLKIAPIFDLQNIPAKNLIGDISKMKQYLHSPAVSFSEGVNELI